VLQASASWQKPQRLIVPMFASSIGKEIFIFPFSQCALRTLRLAFITAKNAENAKNFSKEKLKIHQLNSGLLIKKNPGIH